MKIAFLSYYRRAWKISDPFVTMLGAGNEGAVHPPLFKVAAWKACNFVERDSSRSVFMWILQNF